MNRRQFLAVAAAATVTSVSQFVAVPEAKAQAASSPPITQWKVHSSEGFDAIAFLGALSGGQLYLQHYSKEAGEFGARMPATITSDLAALAKEADTSGFGLLWPNVANIMSGADVQTIGAVLLALANVDDRVRPTFQTSSYWKQSDWDWFKAAVPRLQAVFVAMRKAGFSEYRSKLVGSSIDARATDLEAALAPFDVIKWQRKLTGRDLGPTIEVVLLHFSWPHGVRVQGQRFLQAATWGFDITLRNAAHEMLHPPIPMDGPVAKRALGVLAKDPLISHIVKDHDPKWGYTSLEGYLNEDLVQALDQMISEELGFGRNPADRWHNSDDGIHVLAAGLYGLLREDRWQAYGGSIEAWLDGATKAGRLSPPILHRTAARILERPISKLWPLAS